MKNFTINCTNNHLNLSINTDSVSTDHSGYEMNVSYDCTSPDDDSVRGVGFYYTEGDDQYYIVLFSSGEAIGSYTINDHCDCNSESELFEFATNIINNGSIYADNYKSY